MFKMSRRRLWRHVVPLVAAVAAVPAVVAATASASQAANVDTGATYVFVNRHSGKAMDLYNWSTADNAPIVQWTRNDQAVQQWRFIDVGSGYYQIRSVHSGKVLEVPSANDGSSSCRTPPRRATHVSTSGSPTPTAGTSGSSTGIPARPSTCGHGPPRTAR